ncbi:MAG: hypothetical protein FJ190_12805 [Gammaproteobacteria bacterium]|nr:hypothetical protein [Gammaproteobacteria bacterium]
MKNSVLKKYTHGLILLTGLIFIIAFSGCSDDKKPKEDVKPAASVAPAQPASTASTAQFDHAHGSEVTDMEKHKFEHDFAAQCVAREMKNSTNQEEDSKRISKSCECIATYIMKDLTAQEAEKFIKEHEHPQSLTIKFEAAAYECLQEKTQPAGPKLFGKPTDNNV